VRALAFALVLATTTSVASRQAAAADPPPPPPVPQQRIYYDNLLVGRINPLGLEDQYNLSYRYRLYESSSAALRENHVAIALSPTFSPGITRMGGSVEIKPATVLTLSAGFYQMIFPGAFSLGQSFQNADDDYSDTELKRRDKEGTPEEDNYTTGGWQAHMRAVAVGKVGPIVIRDDLQVYAGDFRLREGDQLYYDQRTDLLVPNGGFQLTNDTDVLYMTDFGLIAGIRTSIAHAFVPDDMLGPSGENPAPIVRVGPAASYTFFDDPGASFNKPAILVLTQWWLKHPWRTGQDVSQALPMIILGFRFEGELWRGN
jgi:hypothetical protein